MNSKLRNVLSVILGLLVGSIVNMGIVMISSSVIPLPEGVDATDMESLKSSLHLFETKHFIFPFLAHALGTLTGAFVAGLIASTKKIIFAYVIGIFFLIGGTINSYLLPAPTWFIVLDLLVAYLPMALIAGKLVHKIQSE